MNLEKVLSQLEQAYPNSKIKTIKDKLGNPISLCCDIELSSDKSVQLFVVDKLSSHKHKISTEIVEVVRGQLVVNKNERSYFLQNGDSIVILPNNTHSFEGNETWVMITTTPGWNILDHIVVDEFKKNILSNQNLSF